MTKNGDKFDDLPPRQREFLAEYLKTGNATASYMTAYGNRKYWTAANCASRLLKRPGIKKILEKVGEKAADSAEVSVERVLSELSGIAFAPQDPNTSRPGVMAQKIKALELLGRHMRMFTDRHEFGTFSQIEARLLAARVRLAEHDGDDMDTGETSSCCCAD